MFKLMLFVYFSTSKHLENVDKVQSGKHKKVHSIQLVKRNKHLQQTINSSLKPQQEGERQPEILEPTEFKNRKNGSYVLPF